jgi:hypothetical protein
MPRTSNARNENPGIKRLRKRLGKSIKTPRKRPKQGSRNKTPKIEGQHALNSRSPLVVVTNFILLCITLSTCQSILGFSDQTSSKMFCDRCQDILNLDILLGTLMNFKLDGPKPGRHPHHWNFADLVASAEAGCTICSFVCANAYSIRPVAENEPIYFRLWPNDLLVFNGDIIDGPEYSLRSISKTFAIVRLSSKEGMCIRYKA